MHEIGDGRATSATTASGAQSPRRLGHVRFADVFTPTTDPRGIRAKSGSYRFLRFRAPALRLTAGLLMVGSYGKCSFRIYSFVRILPHVRSDYLEGVIHPGLAARLNLSSSAGYSSRHFDRSILRETSSRTYP
jgi:hypothetical protein